MKKKKKPIIKIIVILCIIAGIGLLGKLILFPHYEEIELTGSYEIDSFDYWLTEDVIDPFLKDGSMREVQVRAWYPVNFDSTQEKLPVVIASHGSCGTIDNNYSLYRELASHGYTVLAVGHPGHAASVLHSNGKEQSVSMDYMKQMSGMDPQTKMEEAAAIFQEWMKLRMTDLETVMDDFTAKRAASDTRFSSADSKHYIAIGHSAGGSTALGMARVRDDVVAVIALESPCMYDIKGVQDGEYIIDESDYSVPVLHIYSDSGYPHLYEWKQYANNAYALDSDNPNYKSLYYKGVGHMGLCDLSLETPIISEIIDQHKYEVEPREQLIRLNADCLEFLNSISLENTLPGKDVVELVNLRGDETTAYKLADGTYMDRIDMIYIYNGTDAWFDENGVEWNEKAQ